MFEAISHPPRRDARGDAPRPDDVETSRPGREPSPREWRSRRAVMLVLTSAVSAASFAAASARRPDALFVDAMHLRLARGGFVVEAPPDVRRFFVALAARAPDFVSDDELIELLYGWRRDGGPDDAVGALRVHAAKARLIAPALGYAIERPPGGFRALAVGEAAFAEAAE